MSTCKNDKLKEYAALVLRKKFQKRNAWMNISPEVRQQYVDYICIYIHIHLKIIFSCLRLNNLKITKKLIIFAT